MKNRSIALALVAGIVAWASAQADAPLAPLTQDAFLSLDRKGDEAPFVLDVRTPDEYVAGHVPGAVNIPHDQIAARLAEVPNDRDVVLYCRSGRRTALAGQVLADNGYTRLKHLEGDIAAWQERQRPMEVPRDPVACAAALKAGKAKVEACSAD